MSWKAGLLFMARTLLMALLVLILYFVTFAVVDTLFTPFMGTHWGLGILSSFLIGLFMERFYRKGSFFPGVVLAAAILFQSDPDPVVWIFFTLSGWAGFLIPTCFRTGSAAGS